jgi:hypothetical protein
MKKFIIMVVAMILVAIGLGVVVTSSANATTNEEPCVPSEAWTEVIEHPAVTHEEVIVVVDEEAWTETVVVQEAVPAVWANFQPNDSQATFVGPALWPTDARGSWVVHDQLPPGHEGPDGVYSKGNPAKGGNWFYRQAAVPEVTEEVEHPAVTHEETIVVVDEEAWTETIEHPAVTCPEDPEEPTDPEDPVDPQEPEEPQEPQEPNTPVVNEPPAVETPAVPTVINAGL